ncbi:MAG: vanadium-dependent haloperoxidase [Planctomycetia bacterium]|nr:MAG: vanadium-dependent haloperoxidase [Planctomycetia bacterium]
MRRMRWVLASAGAAVLALAGGCPNLALVDPTTLIAEPTAVVKWNEVMLAAVRAGPPRPTVIARSLFIVHSAMYDAWAAYDSKAVGTQLGGSLRRTASERTEANKRAAVSYAAHRALRDQFGAYETSTGSFTRLLRELGYEPSDSTDTSTPAGIGNVAAQAVLDFRQNDGANEGGNYAQVTSTIYPALYTPKNSGDPSTGRAPGGADFDVNRWQPLRVPNGTLRDADGVPILDHNNPATFTTQSFLTPHWGAVTPFALTSGDQFRPPPQPLAGSSEPYTTALGETGTNDEIFNKQFDEVLAASEFLTDERKCVAEYWADGPRSDTPPGHWHALCHGICFRDRHSLDDDVKLFFALAGAQLDASIATWDAKRHYDSSRPISVIRHKYFGQKIRAWAGPNRGTREIDGEDWLPYQAATFVTPPFPGYPSGHSCFSAASAAVIGGFTGTNTFHDGGQTVLLFDDYNFDSIADVLGQHTVLARSLLNESSPAAPVTLRWNTVQDAADEAGISRLYGGIHIQEDDIRSRNSGRAIGRQALEKARAYWEGRP